MNDSRSAVFRSLGSQWVSVAYGATVSFFLFVVFARRLGPSSLAVFVYIQTIASLFAILQDGGFQILLFRERTDPSREIDFPFEKLVSGSLTYVITITLFGSIVVLCLPTAYTWCILPAFAYCALRCITNFISSILKGQGAFEPEALWRMQIQTFLALPALMIIGFTAPMPEKIFLGFIAGQLLLLGTRKGRTFLPRSRPVFPPWGVWKTCLAFVSIGAATTVYFRSGILLLKHLQPDLSLVGHYGAAFQFLEAVTLFATPAAHMVFHHLRRTWQDPQRFRSRFVRILAGTTLVALFFTVISMVCAPILVRLILGKEYDPVADILPLLFASLFFLLPNMVLTQGLIALNGERFYAGAALLCALFNVGLNLLLIPRYNVSGVVFTTAATEALLTLLSGGWFLRWYRRHPVNAGTLRITEEQQAGQADHHV